MGYEVWGYYHFGRGCQVTKRRKMLSITPKLVENTPETMKKPPKNPKKPPETLKNAFRPLQNPKKPPKTPKIGCFLLRVDPSPPPFYILFFGLSQYGNRGFFVPVLTTPLPRGGGGGGGSFWGGSGCGNFKAGGGYLWGIFPSPSTVVRQDHNKTPPPLSDKASRCQTQTNQIK